MVYNTTRHAKLPFSNAMMKSHTKRLNKLHAKGEGMGSVLLRDGGGGVGSSYSDIDDYIRTTGINPYEREGVSVPKMQGSGRKSLSSKLSKLNIHPPSHETKRKNIVMSF
jgi:hypothetical protein